MQSLKGIRLKPWKQITHCAGLDWARAHHAVVIVNSAGEIIADFEFEHTLEGWQRFVQQTAPAGLAGYWSGVAGTAVGAGPTTTSTTPTGTGT